MNNLLKFSIALAFWTSPALAADCRGFLQGFTTWELKVKGQMEPQTDYFDIERWSPSSQFDGIVINPAESKKIKKPLLEIEFRARNGGKLKVESFFTVKPAEADANYQHFTDFKPREFFTFEKAGTFELRLKDGETMLCTSSLPYELGH